MTRQYGRGYGPEFREPQGGDASRSDWYGRPQQFEEYRDQDPPGAWGERYGTPQYGYGPSAGFGYGQRDESRQRSDYGGPGSGQRGPWRDESSHRGHGPQGYSRSDERIKEDVSDELTEHPAIDARQIEVSVKNAEVTLSGSVESRSMKRLAEDVAERVRGVRDIHNQIRVKQDVNASAPRGAARN